MGIEARNRPLPDWFTRIRTRQTVLPRFQRYEAWGHDNVTQLFNTILQGLPVGAVLILEVGNEELFISRSLKGAPQTGERVTEHLLDGQQRLTALWRALHNNYEDRTYFLCLKKDEETGMPYYVDSLARWKKEDDKERRPFWANDAKEQWKRKMIPLDLCYPDINAQERFRQWAKKTIESADERETISYQVAGIRQIFATFNLPFLSLPPTTKKETALDVFIKMNTSAAPLSTYDIVVAQVEAGLDKSLHDLVAEIKTAAPAIEFYYPTDTLVLYASALLQRKPPTNSTYMAKDFSVGLLDRWETILSGAKRTVEFLEQERIFDAARLPTEIIIPVLVALWGLAPEKLDAAGSARTTIRKYLWRAFFTNRYEKSTSARSLADFNELKDLIAGKESSPLVFDENQHPLPQPEELLIAGWPVRKERLARAILALALKHGGLDLADGGEATRASLARREYHHLFPDAHLTRQGVPDDQIYRSLNCALVTWTTNRNISAKDPERYLAERRQGTTLGEVEIKSRLASHLIPYDEMVKNDYNAFLMTRAKLVHTAMRDLCDQGGS